MNELHTYRYITSCVNFGCVNFLSSKIFLAICQIIFKQVKSHVYMLYDKAPYNKIILKKKIKLNSGIQYHVYYFT